MPIETLTFAFQQLSQDIARNRFEFFLLYVLMLMSPALIYKALQLLRGLGHRRRQK